MCQLQLLLLVILLITVLVSHNVIIALILFMPTNYGAIRKLLQLFPPTPPPNRFSPGLLFYKE